MPLFVAITPGMQVTFDDEGGSGGGDGGPRHPRKDFAAGMEDVTSPAPG